jgi:hypothetical protein
MSKSSDAIHLLSIAQQALDIETRVRDENAACGWCSSDWETPMMKKFKEHVQHARQILRSVEAKQEK